MDSRIQQISASIRLQHEAYSYRPPEDFFLVRDCGDQFSKKGSHDRLLLNCVYHCLSQVAAEERPPVLILETSGHPEPELLRQHFPHLSIMRVARFRPAELWYFKNQSILLVSHQDACQPAPLPLKTTLSGVLQGLHAADLWEGLAEVWKNAASGPPEAACGPYTKEAIILPERPGKMKLWSMSFALRKRFQEKSREFAVAAKKRRQKKSVTKVLFQDEALPGSGTGACLLAGVPSGQTARRVLQYYNIRLADKALCLGAPERVGLELIGWLKTRAPLGSISDIIMVCPSWSFALLFKRALLTNWPCRAVPRICFPDLLLGWGPGLSLIQFLSGRRGAGLSLYADASGYPEIACLLSRSESID